MNWITNTEFPKEIGRYSKSFEQAVHAFQLFVSRSPEQSVKEYDKRTIHVVVRPQFPAEVTISHAGADQWVVSIQPSVRLVEGVHAPTLLEIVGNQWTLVSHSDEKNEPKVVVASGTLK